MLMALSSLRTVGGTVDPPLSVANNMHSTATGLTQDTGHSRRADERAE